jgi:D-alanine-D-alanine ligase
VGCPEKSLVFVLLYDIPYMVDYKKSHPDGFSDEAYDPIEDSRQLNEEIRDAVLAHPRIDPRAVRFYTDPYLLMRDLATCHDRVKGILNFCDDFNDRVELMSIPLLFEMYRIPFSCYSADGLFLSHNKFHAYSIAKQLGIPVPRSYYITRDMVGDFGIEAFPVVVKPNNMGGSEGVSFRSFARDPEELREAVEALLKLFNELIACEYLPGMELTLGLVRHEDEIIPLALKSMQFVNFGGNPAMYTYEFKWDESRLGDKQLFIKPFDGDPAIKERVIDDSIRLFEVLECRDFARIDWKCDAQGVPRFIDFNENPMFGNESSFLYCLEQAGYTRRDFFTMIIDNLLQGMN